jgi:2-polyprenyl-6-methoxyphenol hydroxylase-like FAD-dependent oxidoreductase
MARDIDVAVVGGGPAGMAAALSFIKAGFSVKLYERYKYARPAGNILNLWPPPIHALASMGVDIKDLGAPCHSSFRNAAGQVRADVKLPQEIIDEYGGGFVGLLRPELYKRMLAAIPDGVIEFDAQLNTIDERGDCVALTFANGQVVRAGILIGADGIDSCVRAHLWGSTPKRNHDLHIIGGYTFAAPPGAEAHECVLSHNRYVQGTYSSILSDGRLGFQWWLLEAWPDAKPAPESLPAHALKLAQGFPGPLADLVRNTPEANFQRWPIRDRVPLAKWSKGRITLAGDAAHATSPYAAYGAGMSICDGYFLGQRFHRVNLDDAAAVTKAFAEYEACQLQHTTNQVSQAYFLGQLFHHTAFPLTVLRDWVLDWTPLLQRQVGDKNPGDIVAQLKVMGKGIAS